MSQSEFAYSAIADWHWTTSNTSEVAIRAPYGDMGTSQRRNGDVRTWWHVGKIGPRWRPDPGYCLSPPPPFQGRVFSSENRDDPAVHVNAFVTRIGYSDQLSGKWAPGKRAVPAPLRIWTKPVNSSGAWERRMEFGTGHPTCRGRRKPGVRLTCVPARHYGTAKFPHAKGGTAIVSRRLDDNFAPRDEQLILILRKERKRTATARQERSARGIRRWRFLKRDRPGI